MDELYMSQKACSPSAAFVLARAQCDLELYSIILTTMSDQLGHGSGCSEKLMLLWTHVLETRPELLTPQCGTSYQLYMLISVLALSWQFLRLSLLSLQIALNGCDNFVMCYLVASRFGGFKICLAFVEFVRTPGVWALIPVVFAHACIHPCFLSLWWPTAWCISQSISTSPDCIGARSDGTTWFDHRRMLIEFINPGGSRCSAAFVQKYSSAPSHGIAVCGRLVFI